jgi:hypothetical protein
MRRRLQLKQPLRLLVWPRRSSLVRPCVRLLELPGLPLDLCDAVGTSACDGEPDPDPGPEPELRRSGSISTTALFELELSSP